MPRQDASAELAARLIQTLERLRTQGTDTYPTTVRHLGVLTAPEATPEQLARALGKKPFSARILLVKKKDLDSPLALAEDRERLADSPLVLAYALNQVCTAEKPLHTPAKVAAKVEKSLRPAFAASLRRRLTDRALPDTVGVREIRGKPQLYLKRFPLPPDPEVVLAERLVRELQARRARGTGAYPPALGQLLEGTSPSAGPTLVKKALAQEAWHTQAIAAVPGKADTPVALAEDRELLAGSAVLLEFVLAMNRTAGNQALTLADLAKKMAKDLRQSFEQSVRRQLESGALPPAVGCLHIKKKPYLFLQADLGVRPTKIGVEAVTPRAKPEPAEAVSFGRLFEDAFDRLDRQRGSYNLVSLVGLREAVPVPPATFDSGLQQLRREGRFTLSGAEGRHGIRPEERAAGIVEDGNLLLFVSRRRE